MLIGKERFNWRESDWPNANKTSTTISSVFPFCGDCRLFFLPKQVPLDACPRDVESITRAHRVYNAVGYQSAHECDGNPCAGGCFTDCVNEWLIHCLHPDTSSMICIILSLSSGVNSCRSFREKYPSVIPSPSAICQSRTPFDLAYSRMSLLFKISLLAVDMRLRSCNNSNVEQHKQQFHNMNIIQMFNRINSVPRC